MGDNGSLAYSVSLYRYKKIISHFPQLEIGQYSSGSTPGDCHSEKYRNIVTSNT